MRVGFEEQVRKKLGDLIIRLENGNRPKGGVNQYKEGIPSIGGEHLNSHGSFDFSNLKYIPVEFFKTLKRGIIKENDILIVKDGATTGKVSFVDSNFPYKQAAVNEHVFILRTNKDTIPKYLFYILYSSFGQKQILSAFHGAAIGGINTKFVNVVNVPLPSLPVQKKIVSILEKAERLKQRRQRANEETSKIIQSVFYEMFGDPIKNEKRWESKRVDELCTLVRGSSPRPQGDPKYYGGKIPRLMVSDITRDGMYTTPKTDFLTEEGAKLSRPMEKGEVIMAVSGNPGLPTILMVNACIHDGFVGFRNLNPKIKPEFLYYYLLCYKDLHKSQSVGAVFKNLNTTQIKQYTVLMPQIALQNKFIVAIKKIQILKEKQSETTSDINNLFDALMQKAFNGELVR